MRAFVAQIDPAGGRSSSCLLPVPAPARRIAVGIDDTAGHDVLGDHLAERASSPRDVTEPCDKLAAVDVGPLRA